MTRLKKQIKNDFERNWNSLFPKKDEEIIIVPQSKLSFSKVLIPSLSFVLLIVAILTPIVVFANLSYLKTSKSAAPTGGLDPSKSLILHLGDKYLFKNYPDSYFEITNAFLKDNCFELKTTANLPYKWEIRMNNRPSCSLTVNSFEDGKSEFIAITGFLDKNREVIDGIDKEAEDVYYLCFNFSTTASSKPRVVIFDFTNYAGEAEECSYSISFNDIETI